MFKKETRYKKDVICILGRQNELKIGEFTPQIRYNLLRHAPFLTNFAYFSCQIKLVWICEAPHCYLGSYVHTFLFLLTYNTSYTWLFFCHLKIFTLEIMLPYQIMSPWLYFYFCTRTTSFSYLLRWKWEKKNT